MMKIGAQQQGPLCGLYQHRTALSSSFGNWPICQGPLQHPMNARNLRLRGVLHHYKGRRVLAQAQPTQASKVLPVRTKTALRKMPKAELEEEMSRMSLDTKGTKQELVERLHAYLGAQEAEGSPKDTSIADKSQNAPEGWLFEAEAEDADLPPDIKALLKLQAEEGQMGDVQEGPREELEPESSMIFGGSESAEDLQALPKKELQEKLTQRGLPKSGNKAELAQRLHAALAEEQEMLLQDQMEARDELQRQFQQSMINPTSRLEAEEREDPLDPASGIPEDSYDRWAMDIEAELQSPDDDAELSLEDAEAAGATPGAVRDEEGAVLRGRFNRPHAMMDLFEYQGTKAAELAGEDYAAQRRGGAEHNQALAGDNLPSQQRMASPVDSQDEGDLFGISMTGGDAEDDEDDGYENDIENDLEDGFSMAAEEEGDGFDPDMEEEIVREAEARSTPSGFQAGTSEYVGHRNYEALSSRSPDDDEEEDLGLLDTIISAASTESFPQAKLDMDSASSSNGPTTSATMDSPLNLSRRVPKPQSVKPAQAPAVVASQGTSSLDFGTAKDWMSTRLPEVMRLGITPNQLAAEAAPLQSQAASADSSSAFSRGLSEASNRPSWDRSGQVEDDEPASSKPGAPEDQQQAELLLEEDLEDTEAAAADSAAYELDSDLLDELVEDVLGQPGASPEEVAAAQLTSTAVQQELDGAEALTTEAPDGRDESSEAECLSVLDNSASPPAEHDVDAQAEVAQIPADMPDSTSIAKEAASASEAALQVPDTNEASAAEGPEKVLVQGDEGALGPSAGQIADEQDREADQLPTQHSSEELVSNAKDPAPGISEGTAEVEGRHEIDVPSLSAATETQTSSAAAQQMHDTVIPSEQLEQASDEDSEAVAPGSVSAGRSAPPDVPEPQDTESVDDGLTDNHQHAPVEPDAADPIDDRSATLLNGSAEAQSGDSLKEGQASLAKDQQELAALRVEMAQKQGALAALQSQVAAVGRSNEGNTAQIAQLQVAMASLQTQRLDLQRADLSGRLAVLQDIAAQASLNVAAKEDLQEQLQIMRDELTQLEVDLSSRDTEAADLSRKLAHARIKLGDPTAVPPANGHARPSLPGGMRARLGKSDELRVGEQHTMEQDHAPPQQSAERTPDNEEGGTESTKKSTTQPGVVVAAGLLGAFKAIGGMFKRTKKDEQK